MVIKPSRRKRRQIEQQLRCVECERDVSARGRKRSLRHPPTRQGTRHRSNQSTGCLFSLYRKGGGRNEGDDDAKCRFQPGLQRDLDGTSTESAWLPNFMHACVRSPRQCVKFGHAPRQRSELDAGRRHLAKQSFTHGRDDGLGEPECVQLWLVTLPADG